MPDHLYVDSVIVRQWVNNNVKAPDVETQLMNMGYEPEAIEAYLKAFKKSLSDKRLFKGFVCMGTGAFLGFLSCVLTLLNVFPGSFHIVLYGLTVVAILVICLGLYLVFE